MTNGNTLAQQRFRQTEQGQATARAERRANWRAVRWVRDNHPAVWRRIREEARLAEGLSVKRYADDLAATPAAETQPATGTEHKEQ